MRLGSTRRDDPELNLTSLIDVVLLLVIFFMLATTFVTEGRLRVVLPEAGAVPIETTQVPVVITITAQGSYLVNERSLINNSREILRATLQKVAAGDTKRPVTIRADAHATHQSVVTAMDVAAHIGFTQVNIATISQQAEE